MQAFLRAYMVRPNVSGSHVVDNFNFVEFREQTNDSNAFQVRVDHHFSQPRQRLPPLDGAAHQRLSAAGRPGVPEPDSTNRNFGGGWFHTFSPSMILEVRGGVATQPTEDAPFEHPAGVAPQEGLDLPSLDRSRATSSTARPRTRPWTLPGQLGVQGPRRAREPELERGRRPHLAARQPQLQGRLPDAADLAPADEPVRRAALQPRGDARPATRPPPPATRSPPRCSGLPTQIRGLRARPGLHRLPHVHLSGYVQDQWVIKPNLTLTSACATTTSRAPRPRDGTFQSGPDLRTGEWLLALEQMPGVCRPDAAALPARAALADPLQPVHPGHRRAQLDPASRSRTTGGRASAWPGRSTPRRCCGPATRSCGTPWSRGASTASTSSRPGDGRSSPASTRARSTATGGPIQTVGVLLLARVGSPGRSPGTPPAPSSTTPTGRTPTRTSGTWRCSGRSPAT